METKVTSHVTALKLPLPAIQVADGVAPVEAVVATVVAATPRMAAVVEVAVLVVNVSVLRFAN